MKSKLTTVSSTFLIVLILIIWQGAVMSQDYSWQKQFAKVEKTGDLQWKPIDFKLITGNEVRYIDYEEGNDNNNGLSKNSPWKHHPWDERATGKAKEISGTVTYIFKRGVTYRTGGQVERGDRPCLKADESGTKEEPIRLTSSPDWGTGEAIISGSIEVPRKWKKATASDVPERMKPDGIWYINTSGWDPRKDDITYGFVGNGTVRITTLFEIRNGKIFDLHLAREPNWQEPGANFASDYWFKWDGEKQVRDMDENCNPIPDGSGGFKTSVRAFDSDLSGYPCDYFNRGTVWSHYGSFMGTPTPRTIRKGDYNPQTGALITNQKSIQKGSRYMIENLPQLLDAPGEFYYDAGWNKNTGRLFIKLDNPNNAHIELAVNYTSIGINDQSNIKISGLTFAGNGFNGNSNPNTINIKGNCKNIFITNCKFDHITNNAVSFECDDDEDVMDSIWVSDNDFFEVKSSAIRIIGRSKNNTASYIPGGELKHLDLLRNRVVNVGYRHVGTPWSNVPGIVIDCPNTAEIAGNIIEHSFGSGLVVQGGKGGGTDAGAPGYIVPLTRILVHHNKVEHAAIGVNDYGGLALWQGGPIYSYCNITGNSVGHFPGGIRNSGTTNLSYPLYLDGSFKMYNFNNIIWGRKFNPDDPYTSEQSAYFNVFGFMNQFVNNTIVGTGIGFGGTSGNRNDMHGNLLADIGKKFISSNHGGNPSLIGGGDDAASGIDGAGTLAYTNNIFHGDAIAGTLITVRRGAEKDIESDKIETMKTQMLEYPLRLGRLGTDVGGNLPIKKSIPLIESPSASQADFRPSENSKAINNGINYFIPWSLFATVGEWYFNQNLRNPDLILDYHFYMTEAYFQRKTYYKLPAFELNIENATLDNYIDSPSEDWTKGAFLFDGSKYAVCPHSKISDDIRLNINDWWRGSANSLPPAPWKYPEPAKGYKSNGDPVFGAEQLMIFPGKNRRTLDIDTCNLLVEVIFRIDNLDKSYNTVIAGKHDGHDGYQMYINPKGRAGFRVTSDSKESMILAPEQLNDNKWHHVLAEIDRKSGRLRMYVDGALSAEKTAAIPSNASLSNTSDFIIGKDGNSDNYFNGAIDFLRVCQGTLKDSKTTIEELYEWQTNGPVKYDFAGNPSVGKRDIGAMEASDIGM